MKIKTNNKGFTLIELLIVIAIVGILAVAFVPTLLDAPAKGRDSQRVANLSTIRTVLLDAELRGVALPAADQPNGTNVCIEDKDGSWFTKNKTAFGGNIPKDPQGKAPITAACGSYEYVKRPGAYEFGIFARMENFSAANIYCEDLVAKNYDKIDDKLGEAAGKTPCYAILVQ